MAVKKIYILKELKKLDRLYHRAINEGDGIQQDFYSKLALLELCGWIEQSMDDIIKRFKRKLKNPNNIQTIEKEIIEKTHGFEYRSHFRNMLIKSIGIVGVERLERKVNPIKRVLLESALSTLKPMRNDHAHTYIRGATTRLYAPSWIQSFFDSIYEGLKEFESFCN